MSEAAFLQLEQDVMALPIFQLKLLQQKIDQELSARAGAKPRLFSAQEIPDSKKAFFNAIGKLQFDEAETEAIRNLSRT